MEKKGSTMSSKFYYITVATHPHPNLNILNRIVESKSEVLHTLGLEIGQDIGQDRPGYRRFGVKLYKVCEFIRNPKLADEDILLFSDAYDVFYSGNSATILQRYTAMNHPIIFGSEKYCYPDNFKADLYPPHSSPFRFLNSGLYIGRVGALRECMKEYHCNSEIEHEVDDQRWWTDKFLSRPDLIALDYTNEIFLNCLWVDSSDIVLNKETGQVTAFGNRTPQLIHGNGPSKDLLEPMLDYARRKFFS